MSMMPVVRFFCEKSKALHVPFAAEIASFISLSELVGLYQKAKLGIADADQMAATVSDHADKKLAAYGGEKVFVPKDHLARHLPKHVRRDGGELFDTVVTER